MLPLKIIFFIAVLCFVGVKMPFQPVVIRILTLAKDSFALMSDRSVDEDQQADQLRMMSVQVLLQTLRILLWLTALVAVALALWFGLNFKSGFDFDSFSVFFTGEGILFSILGISLYAAVRKLIQVVRL